MADSTSKNIPVTYLEVAEVIGDIADCVALQATRLAEIDRRPLLSPIYPKPKFRLDAGALRAQLEAVKVLCVGVQPEASLDVRADMLLACTG